MVLDVKLEMIERKKVYSKVHEILKDQESETFGYHMIVLFSILLEAFKPKVSFQYTEEKIDSLITSLISELSLDCESLSTSYKKIINESSSIKNDAKYDAILDEWERGISVLIKDEFFLVVVDCRLLKESSGQVLKKVDSAGYKNIGVIFVNVYSDLKIKSNVNSLVSETGFKNFGIGKGVEFFISCENEYSEPEIFLNKIKKEYDFFIKVFEDFCKVRKVEKDKASIKIDDLEKQYKEIKEKNQDFQKWLTNRKDQVEKLNNELSQIKSKNLRKTSLLEEEIKFKDEKLDLLGDDLKYLKNKLLFLTEKYEVVEAERKRYESINKDLLHEEKNIKNDIKRLEKELIESRSFLRESETNSLIKIGILEESLADSKSENYQYCNELSILEKEFTRLLKEKTDLDEKIKSELATEKQKNQKKNQQIKELEARLDCDNQKNQKIIEGLSDENIKLQEEIRIFTAKKDDFKLFRNKEIELLSKIERLENDNEDLLLVVDKQAVELSILQKLIKQKEKEEKEEKEEKVEIEKSPCVDISHVRAETLVEEHLLVKKDVEKKSEESISRVSPKYFNFFSRTDVNKKLIEKLDIIRSSSLFDEEWYYEKYPDVKESGVDAATHYLKFGAKELRDPSCYFSTRWYLESYSDVEESGINPLYHYIIFGENENRTICDVKRAEL